MTEPITIRTTVKATPAQAWSCFTDPSQITRWNAASDDWSCPTATTDLRPGGAFSYRMAARDGSMAFDFAGTWAVVEPHDRLVQVLDGGRRVEITFSATPHGTLVEQSFDPEPDTPRAMQEAGWQSILDRFSRVASTG